MTHIDEGTIHAWLDGALPPGEASRVQAHVASCTDCSAVVAEARGLVAASSRILSALDQVPAGVIPRTEAAPRRPAGSADPPLSAAGAAPRRRPWYLRPQYAAAASIAFIAVSATLVVRNSGNRSVADFQRAAETGAAPSPAPTASALAGPEAGAGGAEPRPSSPVVDSAAPEPNARRTAQERADSVPVTVRAAVARPEAKVSSAPLDSIPKRVALNPDAITTSERERVTGDAGLAQRREAAPPATTGAQASPAAAPPAPPAPVRAPAGGATKLADEASRPSTRTLSSVGVTAARRASTPAATLAGCYRLERSEPLRLAGAGERWQLEAVAAGTEGDLSTFVARDLVAADSIRAGRRADAAAAAESASGWRWAPLAGDQVLLLRGAGASVQRYVVSMTAASGTSANEARERREEASAAITVRAVRINCPQR